ncbi:MAG TPA: hypothetical protein VGP72_00360 [Planctomycetota bacterium]
MRKPVKAMKSVQNRDRQGHASAAERRYSDAYAYAGTLNTAGTVFKIIGAVVAFLGVASAIYSSAFERQSAVAVFLLGLLAGVACFWAGLLSSAFGQMMLAMLDMSVNSERTVELLEANAQPEVEEETEA